jgi:hypothetical protein
MMIRLYVCTLIFFSVLVSATGVFALVQTQLSTDQRSPKIPQVVEWGVCKDPVPNPTPNVSCVGLEMMRFRYSDGSTKVYTLVPATPNIATETKFVRVPLN